jgi:hypothetical protein
MRLPLIDGHGNFGSLDSGPAAMRYTECRMATTALAMTDGLDEDTVDFKPNYDSRELEPVVLPAAIPHLVVNGATGSRSGWRPTSRRTTWSRWCRPPPGHPPRGDARRPDAVHPGPDLRPAA